LNPLFSSCMVIVLDIEHTHTFSPFLSLFWPM
jgi:hypothetical protein